MDTDDKSYHQPDANTTVRIWYLCLIPIEDFFFFFFIIKEYILADLASIKYFPIHEVCKHLTMKSLTYTTWQTDKINTRI